MKLSEDDLNAIKELMEVTIEEKGVTKDEFEERIRNIPTKEEYLKGQAEIMGELKAVREEQTTHAGDHDRLEERMYGWKSI